MENKFQSIKDWLNEAKSKKEETYGCVMLYADIENWEEDHLEGIEERDVFIKPEDDSFGLEDEPHMTLVYGIHEDEIDPTVIRNVMEQNLHPVKVLVENIGIFENEEFDVVKYDIPVTPEIEKYRKLFMKFPNTQTFPDFKPHITIAYVKPGEGKKYVKKLEEPLIVIFNKAVYSWHENEEKIEKQYVFPKEEIEELT